MLLCSLLCGAGLVLGGAGFVLGGAGLVLGWCWVLGAGLVRVLGLWCWWVLGVWVVVGGVAVQLLCLRR